MQYIKAHKIQQNVIDTHALASSARVAAATSLAVKQYLRPVAVEGLTSVCLMGQPPLHSDAVDTHTHSFN